MSPITTHVLDTMLGRPAEGVPVTLELRAKSGWKVLAKAATNADGRISDLLPPKKLAKGIYRMSFNTAAYFRRARVQGFYPAVSIVFQIREAKHHHVPLLLSPFGYSTYRGS